MIDLEDYYRDPATGHDRRLLHPDANHYEGSAGDLLRRVNGLFIDLGLPIPAVTSGWRDPAANAKAGGATHSLHMEGRAIDLHADEHLWKQVAQRPDLLRARGLWLEAWTPGQPHLHLDTGARGDRPSRVFHA